MQTANYYASQNAVIGDDGTNMMMDDTTTTNHYINYRHRYLAPGGAEAEIDYTVVSVGVMTLGLLLVVEFVRHSLDHAAIGRPFFKAVLEGVYSELATLGIVELFIFLLHRYYEDLNVARELVFADVHFALFYTAIFNAFQSVIVAILSSRVSTKAWVVTEHLELDHYVELREEFDRIQAELLNGVDDDSYQDDNYDVFEFSWKALKRVCRSVVYAVRYPRLRARYTELLVQIRFHQLRVQFLEANDLPMTLKVSSYLKKAENSVFIKLIHVSTFAWLLLTGGLNLVYYLMGMVAFITEDKRTVGRSLTWLFFGMLVLFILISLVVYNKMKAIFRVIIQTRRLGYVDVDSEEVGRRKQLELFWGGDPKVVIAMIQFMQFGYALGLAIIMIFWEDIGDGQVEPGWYLFGVLSCYGVFLMVMAQVIPQYTLCTSLGHLVDQKQLQETVALYRLEEAERKQKRKLAESASFFMDDSSVVIVGGDMQESKESNQKKIKNVQSKDLSKEDGTEAPIKTISLKPSSQKQELSVKEKKAKLNDDKTQLLAELVKMDTQTLRMVIPKPAPKPTRAGAIRDRRNRRKSVSDGVQTMRMMGMGTSAAAANLLIENDNGFASLPSVVEPTKPLEGPVQTLDDTALAKRDIAAKRRERRARHKAVSASAVIKSWQDLSVTDSNAAKAPGATADGLAKPFFSSSYQAKGRLTRHLPGGLLPLAESNSSNQIMDDTALARRDVQANRRERRARHKAVSASAVIKSWQDLSVTDASAPSEIASSLSNSFGRPSPGGLHPLEESSACKGNGSGLQQARIDEETSEQPDQLFSDEVPPSLSGDAEVTDSLPLQEDFPNEFDKSIQKVLETDELGDDDDDDTVDTAKSIGALSDVSVDVPPSSTAGGWATASQKQSAWIEPLKGLSVSEIKGRLRRFYISNRYLSMSHVFGTITCFFFVGNRVEILLHEDGVIVYGDQTIVLKAHVSFWLEVVWLASFLLGSFMIIFLFPKSERVGSEEARSLVLAAAFDILISGACLGLLFYADSKRCCDSEIEDYGSEEYENASGNDYDNLHRILGGAELDSAYGSGYGNSEYGYGNSYNKNRDCCPFWGYRWYGGLGTIEPLTSLVGLRVMRFLVARIIVRYFDGKATSSRPGDDTSEVDGKEKNPFRTVLFGPSGRESAHKASGGKRSSMRDEIGTPLHLWEKAIARYPDIVEKYGEFSSQLFQAMLGLELLDDTTDDANMVSDDIVVEESPPENKELNDTDKPENTESPQKDHATRSHRRDRSMGQCFVLAGKQYENLPLEAQEIILSGKLGKPVHCKSSANLLRLEEDVNGDGVDSPTATVRAPAAKSLADQQLEFEIDDEKLALESKADNHGFIAPSARLVRSMRRCDRRLVPLLTTWGPVDVAITRFEIVYFEAIDDSNVTTERTSARLALIATKGGKGLRLCDVAIGRKVVGHLDLSEVVDVHVERDMPIVDLSMLDDLEASNTDAIESQLLTEYWHDGESRETTDDRSPAMQSRGIRWAKVKEDRLRLTTIHGILFLRFYSDLEDTEAHLERSLKENEQEGPITKNISFQWAQTIGRFCGRDQLKQILPHLGDNTVEELRDYLEVVHYHEKEAAEKLASKKGHHRRLASADFFFPTPTEKPSPAKPHRRFRSSVSFGPSETSSAERQKSNPKTLRHAQSFNSKPPIAANATNIKKKLRRSISAGESASSSGPTNYGRSSSDIVLADKFDEEVDHSMDFDGVI